jgi:hypothetical protein
MTILLFELHHNIKPKSFNNYMDHWFVYLYVLLTRALSYACVIHILFDAFLFVILYLSVCTWIIIIIIIIIIISLISLFICLFVYLFVCLFAWLFACLL